MIAAFDTELFGHWWYEGPAQLRVLRALPAMSRRAIADGSSATRQAPYPLLGFRQGWQVWSGARWPIWSSSTAEIDHHRQGAGRTRPW